VRRYAAEFLGTFLLVFAGPGAVVIDEVSGGDVGSLGIGLSFGLAVMAAIYSVGHLSGAHTTPLLPSPSRWPATSPGPRCRGT